MNRLSRPNRLLTTSLPIVALAAATVALVTPRPAEACGCFSPPEVTEGDYGVNQQAEQIIFEVGEGTVTAHVLIRYAGDPSQFAWIVPVPNQPQLALSETMAFALLDEDTAPRVFAPARDVCPDPAYVCRYHPECPDTEDTGALTSAGGGTSGGGGGTGGGGGGADGVDVLDMQVVGDYETVTFAATDADLAVQWLQDNGFIVNDTTTPYMQPYIDAGMVFVAAKLVAGAGIDSIRPLKMTYQGDKPMIPLQLTAVAAEPHLTVTSYIYGDTYFAPQDHPLAEIDPGRISADAEGRVNYPMVLARTIDEAGGDAFVAEYAGWPTYPNQPNDPGGCCDLNDDWCFIGYNGVCECPGADFEAEDCADVEGLQEGGALLWDLKGRYSTLTRLTTRISPEEMTFDPLFGATQAPPANGWLSLVGSYDVLTSCAAAILDTVAALAIDNIEGCASMYCGAGTCVATPSGPGCACDAGYVARTFTDLDGEPSVTCVPATPPVDLGKGLLLPDACDGVSCGEGACVDLNGFAACACNGGAGAVASAGSEVPVCDVITDNTGSPGAENFSAARQDLKVCAPTPPECGESGWLVPNSNVTRPGVMCESSMPAPEDLMAPPAPECDGGSGSSGGAGGSEAQASCACRPTDPGDGLPAAAFSLALLGLLRRRRSPRG